MCKFNYAILSLKGIDYTLHRSIRCNTRTWQSQSKLKAQVSCLYWSVYTLGTRSTKASIKIISSY